MSIKIEDIAKGDRFSESNHVIALGRSADSVTFFHVESGQEVVYQNEYVKLLKSADQYETEVIVGKLDKVWTEKQIEELLKKGPLPEGVSVGTVKQKGMRTLFAEIFTEQVFKATFRKKDVPKTKKALAAELAAQNLEAVTKIEKTATAKKGVADVAKDVIKYIQENPISAVVPGELRVLNGYKLQFNPTDGNYLCRDLDITPGTDAKGRKEDGTRLVNINTITELIYDGVRYILEK